MRFILVDEILEMTPGKTIRATKTMDAGEDVFPDHFPGFPVVPGVLLAEMMAQAAGKCLDAEDPRRGKAMLARIRGASFRRWVLPGQKATIAADIQVSRQAYASAKCRVEVERELVAEADLLFTFVPLDRFAPDYRDEVLQRFLDGAGRREGGDDA